MANKIKKNDFIKLDYTGKFADDEKVFDTTKESVAKKEEIYDEKDKDKYNSLIICVGQGQVIKGLDEALVGKEPEKKFTVEIKSEDGFGKKDLEKVQLISLSKFKKQGVKPMAGMAVNIDDQYGVVKTISGGRVIVDFNHPLASKDLVYDVEIHKKIKKDDEKVKVLVKSMFGLESDVKIEDKKAEIKLKVPEKMKKEAFNEQIKKVMKDKIEGILNLKVNIKV